MNAHRLFVAIAVPAFVKERLAEVQGELREMLSPHSASWTKLNNMHLTLRFLGQVEEHKIAELKLSLEAVIKNFGRLELICERLGCFPDLRYPRVIWAWVHDEPQCLNELVLQINAATKPFAEKPPDARFEGHITLARPRQIRRPEAKVIADFVRSAVERRFGAWSASEVELIQSQLSPGGSRYTTLAKFSLEPNA